MDTVVILTDGAPSGGDRWDIELMGGSLGRRSDFDMWTSDGPLRLLQGLKRRWAEVVDALGGGVLSID